MACRPWWHDKLAAGHAASRAAGTPSTDPCALEGARQEAEAFFRAAGFSGSLNLETFTLARIVRSEGGSGTPEEKVALAEAAINHRRAHKSRWGSLAAMATSGTGCFGSQSGSSPPLSSRQDPEWEDVEVAKLALSGATQNYAGGATNFFSPRGVGDALTLHNSWAAGGLHWIGDVPGIRTTEQFFMAPGAPSDGGAAGRAALTSPVYYDVSVFPACPRSVFGLLALAAAGVAGMAYIRGKRLMG